MSKPIKQLVSPSLLREMHHLFWIDPHENNGTWDSGWSCREHAWVSALLLRIWGHPSNVISGKAAFLPRTLGKSDRPVIVQQPHAWVGIEREGFVDTSPKPSGQQLFGTMTLAWGDPFPLGPILGNRVLTRGKSKVVEAFPAEAFASTIERLFLARDVTSAVYCGEYIDELVPQFVLESREYINSPLTDRLREKCGDLVYVKAAYHLLGIAEDSARSLTGLEPDDAWRAIDTLSDDALDRIRDRARM